MVIYKEIYVPDHDDGADQFLFDQMWFFSHYRCYNTMREHIFHPRSYSCVMPRSIPPSESWYFGIYNLSISFRDGWEMLNSFSPMKYFNRSWIMWNSKLHIICYLELMCPESIYHGSLRSPPLDSFCTTFRM